MRVMAIVKAIQGSEAGNPPSEKLIVAMGKFNQTLADAGILLSGEGLQDTAKTEKRR